ncbi:polysaccharide pyruvyl transferase family protein [Adlercreutzia sp. ZJ304]|uniref:polysaccharide pyruvyl transferase family protein n=1 Tax=Adlercreutzia sp. ZJ304 TaxID=2709791 RepID=UPI0013EBC578|nr:polysaccharide pyruvyl transferase family protein [Adlercreutzia sp. ZJ304]
MKICVLGWYGTETLGDRAILDGIVKIFAALFESIEFHIGSLYPFFTERTLFEDRHLLCSMGCNFVIFNESNIGELKSHIRQCDIVLMGGGPLMDLREMYLVYRGIKYGKHIGKKTLLLGCGYGPLKTPEFQALVNRIFDYCDLVIFRDEESKSHACSAGGKSANMIVLDDPAIASIIRAKKIYSKCTTGVFAAVNFRRFPSDEYGMSSFSEYEAAAIVDKLAVSHDVVKLVPMHTFCIGGDDREFLYEVKLACSAPNVEVMSMPPSLEELYSIYSHAKTCVGMRYHSIVMQTILNGNNYYIDYTGSGGKISAFFNHFGIRDCKKRCLFSVGTEEALNLTPLSNQLKSLTFDIGIDPIDSYIVSLYDWGIV